MKRSLFILLVLLTLAAPAPGQDPATPDEAALRSAIGVRQQTQQARDQWAGEREALAARLDGLSGKKEELAARKARLAGEVESLSRAVARQEASTAEVAGLSGSLSPLVSEMRETLGTLFASGPPAFSEERRQALEDVDRVLADPGATGAARLSALFDALFEEAGRAASARVYRQTVKMSGQTLLADVLALGRVALFFQSPDHELTGLWDLGQGEWKPVPRRYASQVRAAMDMADRRRPADLTALPLGRLVKP